LTKLNISVNGLNGHQVHTSSQNKLPDQFPTSGVCPTVTDPPIDCGSDAYVANNGSCVTCPNGQIVDPFLGESCVVGAYPTVDSKSTPANIAAVLTGTVGSSTYLTIRIYDQNTIQKSSGSATVIGTTWSYQAPLLSAGTYDVEAEGDMSHGSLIDRSDNELVVLAIAPVAPTVTSTTSTDLVAVPISGGATTSSTISSVTLTKIKDGLGATVSGATPSIIGTNLTVTNNAWTVTSGAVAVGTYTITAKDGNNLSGTGTLTVTSTASHTPTISTIDGISYSSPTAVRTANTTPVVTGYVDSDSNGTLGDDAFTVSFAKNGGTTTGGTLNPVPGSSSQTWTATPSTALTEGTYNIIVTRAATPDATFDELIVGGIQVCELPAQVDKTISVAEWDSNKYVLGTCASATTMPNMPPNPYPDPQPERTPSTSEDCTTAEGGGKRSTLNVEQATIKRAKIINAMTQGGTTTETLNDVVILYGEKTAGTMDISHAHITNNVATGVTLTGVTLANFYIDMTGSFDLDTGEFTLPESSIDVSGGITNPSGTGSPNPKSTIIDGIITNGVSAGSPVRGRVVEGRYDVTTTTTSVTKGRRVSGTLTGATITGATTTTAKMADNSIKTVVQGGTIEAGASLAITSVFGTVVNAKIENANGGVSTLWIRFSDKHATPYRKRYCAK
jgi:hypothetical protein